MRSQNRASEPAGERPLQGVAKSLHRDLGKALVRVSDELTVYLFGGEEGRRLVNQVWAERDSKARSQR